jgi:ankyrin repeat protein
MNKSNIIDIINNINSYSNDKKLNQEFLNTLEKAIMNNYISIIKETFMAGETIYYNGINNVICNGFYQKKFEIHPQVCHNCICYKTPVYYSLWLNTYYYSNIFSTFIEILDESPILWFNMNNIADTREKKIKNLSVCSKKLYDFIISIDCSCFCVKQFVDFYDNNNMNFEKVEKFLISNFDDILNQFENVYGFGVYNKDDNYEMICHKKNIGKYYLYSNIQSDQSVYSSYSDQNIRNKLEFLRQIWNKYKINCDIVKIMFNQQSYEYYKHHLKTKFFKLQSIIDKISSNPYIDINYSLHGNNIFGITITEQNRPELTNKLIKLNAKIPSQLSFDEIIKICDITNVKEIIKNYKEEYFGDIKKTVKSIISYDNIMSCDKIEIVEILNKRGILEKVTDVISIFLEHNLSYNFIEKIYENQNIIKQVSIYEVFLCIKYIKQKELDMILKNNDDLINAKYNNKELLFHYFDELSDDIPSSLDILKILLLNKANANIRNSAEETPLIISIKNKSIKAFEMLLKFGGDPFLFDNKGFNSFHYAIKNNCEYVIKLLIKYENAKKEKIINIKTYNKQEYSNLVLAMENTTNPINLTKILLMENSINYDVKTESGDNLLFFILNLRASTSTKCSLFSMYLKKNINLLEPSKISMKPLIVEAVDKNYYDIVIMIMNKLLQLGEIRFKGFDNIKDITILLKDKNSPPIIIKNENFPNFYSLVMVYLKNNNTNNSTAKNTTNFEQNSTYYKNIDNDDTYVDLDVVINGLCLFVLCIFFIFYIKDRFALAKIAYDEYIKEHKKTIELRKAFFLNKNIPKNISKKKIQILSHKKKKYYSRQKSSSSSSYSSSDSSSNYSSSY